MSRRQQFIAIAALIFIAVWVLLSLLLILLAGVSDDEPPSPAAAQTLPADVQFAPPVTTEEAEPFVPSPEPTLDREALKTDMASVEGVSDIRIFETSPFQGLWLVYLEIDVQAGYDNTTTADALKSKIVAYTGENLQLVLILWDRINRATNYAWDLPTQTWLTTMVVSNPE